MVDAFFDNMTLIIAVVFLINRLKMFIINKRNSNLTFKRMLPVMSGLLSFLVMLEPFVYKDMVFDLRNVPVFLVSYTVGWKSGLITAFLPAIYRLYLGGNNANKGIFLSLILAVLIGALVNRYKQKESLVIELDLLKVLKFYLLFHILRSLIQFIMLDIPVKLWFEINIALTTFSILSVLIIILIIKDFNKVILSKKELKTKVNYDSMTNLLNFESFKVKVEDIMNKSQNSIAVIMLDIDYFKNYNDANGHLAGDRAIKKVAQILRDNVRNNDLVARYGGEEFIIAVTGVSNLAPEVLAIAKRIREEIEKYEFEKEKNQPEKRLTVSIGISTLGDNKSLEELMEEADKALYNAKDKGRNEVVVTNDLTK